MYVYRYYFLIYKTDLFYFVILFRSTIKKARKRLHFLLQTSFIKSIFIDQNPTDQDTARTEEQVK